MTLLVAFAFLAGAGTAVSPCVLPVLPAVLAATGAGGRRRPLGVVIGLSVTFTVTIVGLAKVVDGIGLGTSVTRYIAIVVLLLAGAALVVPAVAGRLEAPLSRLARFGPSNVGDGFISGLLVGAALGFVYVPCAGPILAAVISVSAASGRTVAVGIAYALGTALVLLLLSLTGRRVLDRVRAAGRGPTLQRVLGAVLMVTAVMMITRLDISFEQAIAQHAPNLSLTSGLEGSSAVSGRLRDLRGGPGRFEAAAQAAPSKPKPAATTPAAPASSLRDLGPAPDFTGTQKWFNTPGGKPLTLASLRGRVVLIDFWTYTCINCLRTLPYLEAWDRKYRADGLTIVGVHSPEFSFEHDAGNVSSAVNRLGIKYPVAQDNDLATWAAWGNQYWPAEYLIDARGHVRHVSFGEGRYAKTEQAIRSLLAESGQGKLGTTAQPRGVVSVTQQATPETYLGSARAERFDPQPPTDGVHDYPGAGGSLPLSHFALSGRWNVTPERATALPGAALDASIEAKAAYLVLGSKSGKPRRMQVLVDGKLERTVVVSSQRLYTLVSRPTSGRFHLTLRPEAGISAFAFTFG